jgi:recombination protein RecA
MAKTTKNNNRAESFEAALKAINSKFANDLDDNLIAKLSEKPRDVEVISSGSLVLDSILGGGFPKGRIIEIYGPESSGKTSIALTAAGYVQAQGGNVAFIDLENALDPKYAAKLGVDVKNLAVAQPSYAEQALDLVDALAETGTVDLIIVDSVAALVPLSELEGSMENQTMALVARILSKALRKLVGTANRTGTTVIFINQIREKVGFVLGNPETTTGGKALKFFASQRIDIRRKEQIKEGKNVIGNKVRLKIVKNKIAPPFLEGFTVLTFNKGINKQAEMVEVGPDYGVIKRPNTRTYVVADTDEVIGTSKATAIERLESDPELFEHLQKLLKENIEKAIDGVTPVEDLEDLSDPDSIENIEEDAD